MKIVSVFFAVASLGLFGMTYFPERKRNRMQGYDYSLAGAYFVTICAKHRIPWFGKIIDGKMVLSDVGQQAYKCWLNIPRYFPAACLDEFIIMPDHLHGIIFLNDLVGADHYRPISNKRGEDFRPLPENVSSVIRGFKIGVTKWCQVNDCPDFAWQRSFHDHIIRNEKSLDCIRRYILKNPETSK